MSKAGAQTVSCERSVMVGLLHALQEPLLTLDCVHKARARTRHLGGMSWFQGYPITSVPDAIP
jgi:hypothetical protein